MIADRNESLGLIQAQIKAVEDGIAEMKDELPKDQYLEALSTFVVLKQRAVDCMFETLQNITRDLQSNGVSDITIATIGKVFQQSINTAAAQLTAFGLELGAEIHKPETELAYQNISYRVAKDVEELLETFVEHLDAAKDDPQVAKYAEIYDIFYKRFNK